MADVEYSVLANLGVEGVGTFKGAMNSAAGGMKNFGGGVAGVASKITDLGFSAVSMAAKVAAATSAIGMAAVTAGAVSIGKNMSMLEDKSIQLGAVMAAATSRPFEDARKDSNLLFAQFRKDAITSAGETADFVGVASNLAGPLLGAGKSMADLRSITQGVIASAPALGVAFSQAGTDVMRMFQGSAGAELPFFKALQSIPELGIQSAEAFNKLDMAKRIELTEKALRNPAFIAASEAMGSTWTGLSSTITDQVKTIGAAIGSPVFEAVKSKMKAATDLMMPKLDAAAPFMKSMTAIGEQFAVTAAQIGYQWSGIFPNMSQGADGLAKTLENGVQKAMSKVLDASGWIVEHWDKITAGAHAFVDKIEHGVSVIHDMIASLGGGDFMTGLERVGMGGVAVKTAEHAAPIARDAFSITAGLSTILKALGAGGTAATAAGGGGAAEGAAVVAGGFGTAATAGVVAAVGVAFLAVKEAVERNSYGIVDSFKGAVADLTTALGGLWDSTLKLYDASKPLLNVIGVLLVGAAGAAVDVLWLAAKAITAVVDATTWLVTNVTDLVTHSTILNSVFSTMIGWIDDIAVKLGKLVGRGTVGEGEALIDVSQMAVRIGTIEGGQSLATDFWMPDIGAPAAAGRKAKQQGPSAGGARQQIDVRLKVDVSGGEGAEALFVRSEKALAKALEDAANKARISTSTIRGVTI